MIPSNVPEPSICEPDETISDAYIRYVFPDEVGFASVVKFIEERALESPEDYYRPPGSNEILFYLDVLDTDLLSVIQSTGGMENHDG